MNERPHYKLTPLAEGGLVPLRSEYGPFGFKRHIIMTAGEARQLAGLLNKKADEADAQRSKVVEGGRD